MTDIDAKKQKTKTKSISNVFGRSEERVFEFYKSEDRKFLIVPPVNPLDEKVPGTYHAVDYYRIWNRLGLLERFESDNDVAPQKHPKPYSEFSRFIGENDASKFMGNHSEISENIQLLEITTQIKLFKYILKRHVKKFQDLQKAISEESPEISDFERLGFEEYIMAKLYSLGPYGTEVRGFNIVLLQKQDILVTELLMDFGGESVDKLAKSIRDDPRFQKELFIHLTTAHYIMESHNLAHYDIKKDNILLKEVTCNDGFKMIIPIFIDFDIGLLLSKSIKLGEPMKLRGISSLESSPEYYNNFGIQDAKGFDPWKSQIYSCAISIPIVMGFSSDQASSLKKYFNESDNPKYKSEDWQISLNEQIENLAELINHMDKKKILYLVAACLNYNPNKRPTTLQLLNRLSMAFSQDLGHLHDAIKVWERYNPYLPNQNLNGNSTESQQIKLLQSQIEQFKENAQSLEKQIIQKNTENAELTKKNTNLEKDLKYFRDKFDACDQKNNELQKKYDELLKKCEELQKEKDELLYEKIEDNKILQNDWKKQNDNKIKELEEKYFSLSKTNEKNQYELSHPEINLKSTISPYQANLPSLSMSQNFTTEYMQQIRKQFLNIIRMFYSGRDNLPKNFQQLLDVREPVDMLQILLTWIWMSFGSSQEIGKLDLDFKGFTMNSS